jgi:endonuclease/exonuclease/phosphatase family metal-dependent hydrolase
MLAFAIWQLLSIFQINSQVDEKPKDGLHIMSYNTMSLLYKKVHRYDDNHDAIAKFIKKENPDIICLQETYWKNWNFGYPYQGKSHSSYSILSKYPVINDGVLPIVNNKLKPFHFADIVWKKDTIRVINMHMASYKFTKDNYDLIKLDKTEQEEVTNGVISILRKLKKGLKKKQKQLKVLLPFIKKSPYPVFLCGDLNDISHSNTYHQIKNLLNDSHKSAGFGLGSSIHTVPFPLRIDYIFYSKEYRCVNHTILSKKLSDHLAISAYFVKK